MSICALSDNKALIAYRDALNSNHGTTVVLSVSGATITVGAIYVFNNVATYYISACALSDTKALISYQVKGQPYYGTAVVVSISGMDIAFGGVVVFESSDTSHISSCALSDTKVLIAYADGGNSNYGTAIILSIAGTSATCGAQTVFRNAAATNISVCALSDTKALVVYSDGGNSNYATVTILSVSETTITCGDTKVFENSNAIYLSACALSEDRALISYSDGSSQNLGKAVILSLSERNLACGSPVILNDGGTSYFSSCILSDSKAVVTYCDHGNSLYGTAVVIQKN